MAITKDAARKFRLVAEVTIAKADLVTGVADKVMDLPLGAVLDDIYLVVDTLFDPTTSAVVEVGTALATTNDIIASQNIFTGQALGARDMTATAKGKVLTTGGLWAKYTSGGGLATVGQLRLVVEYHNSNEADFLQKK